MELSERMQVERYELGRAADDAALRSRGAVAVPVLTFILAGLAALLTLAATQAFDGWPHAIVLGAIVTTTIGLMIAIAPERRG